MPTMIDRESPKAPQGHRRNRIPKTSTPPQNGVSGPPGNHLADLNHVPAASPRKRPRWSAQEIKLRQRLEAGETVVLNPEVDLALVEWTCQRGLYVLLDGQSEWGDWGADEEGDPVELLTSYAVYLALKKTLHPRILELKGKALGCSQRCRAGTAARCPADLLALLANSGSETLAQMLQVAARFCDEDLNALAAWVQQRLPSDE